MLNKRMVFIIENGVAVNLSSKLLLNIEKIKIKSIKSANAFFRNYRQGVGSCLLIGVNDKPYPVFEILEKVLVSDVEPPCIIYTHNPSAVQGVEFLRKGAFDVLISPTDFTLFESINLALYHDTYQLPKRAKRTYIQELAKKLNTDERVLFKAMASGKSNAIIAEEFELSSLKLESYRAKILNKMGVNSVEELVQMRRFIHEVGAQLFTETT